MFNSQKRIWAVAAAITLPALAALWSAVLSRLTPQQHPYLSYLYVGAIVTISGGVAFYTHVRPIRDLEKPILKVLSILAEGPLKLGSKNGIKPRLNLMVIVRPWYLFGGRRIKIVWGIGMDNFPDVRFSCKTNQGVVGEALLTQRPVLMNCEQHSPAEFGFNQQQSEQTKHLTAVWSLPIYEVDSKGQQTGRVIGTLNFDSTAADGFAKIQACSEGLEQGLLKLCEMISMIL